VPAKQDVSFAPECDSSAVRACVDVLLLIAAAVRLHFPALLSGQEADEPPAWHEALLVLANILFQEMRAKRITSIIHANNVWNQFMANGVVRALGATGKKAINDAGAKILADAIPGNAGIGTNILWDANIRAERWIRNRILPHVDSTPFGVAPLVIDFDEAGTQFCASSLRLVWEIHWTLQPFEHSLFGAMVASRVLEHEYFSHLLPRNQHLSKGVREVWLVETLEEEHRNDTFSSSQDVADMKLQSWFRLLLEQHFNQKGQVDHLSLQDFEEVAVRIRRKSLPDFWKMTAEILSLRNNKRAAEIVDRGLKLLRSSPDIIVDTLTVPWRGFPACLETASSIVSK
jgi:hypothetical protein